MGNSDDGLRSKRGSDRKVWLRGSRNTGIVEVMIVRAQDAGLLKNMKGGCDRKEEVSGALDGLLCENRMQRSCLFVKFTLFLVISQNA